MKTILNDIKDNRLKQAYLLYGEEVYLRDFYKGKLLEAMVTDGDTMNYNIFEGKDIEAREIISISDTLPFFAEYRTILIKYSGFFKTANDELCDYFKQGIPESTRFIFVEDEVDKRNRFYKIVKDLGNAVEFKTQDDNTLTLWIKKLIGQEGKQISAQSIAYLLAKTGSDMSNIKNELEKLFSYTDGREYITNEDIDAIVTTRLSDHIFAMLEAIGLKARQKALNMYYELLSLKEPPMKILVLLTRQFNMILQVKDLRNNGYSKPDIAKKMGMAPFIVDKYMQQASKFETKFLMDAVKECVATDENVKSGRISDRLGVELLIVKYSM
jgi:DNA polymerase-3 subunit delta